MERKADESRHLEEVVGNKYAREALRVVGGGRGACCGPSPCCGSGGKNPVTADLYGEAALASLPEEILLASLGCGDPTALADLQEGEMVLDLGSGGGIDAILSARRVGPRGKVYGLDLTDEMLLLARTNARKAGVENVEFLKGSMEAVPLPDESVDVVLSNCAVNLAADKLKVLQEAFRVLRAGGRLAVADIVVRGGELPPEVRKNRELWARCLAGALREEEFLALLHKVGFERTRVETTRVYGPEDVRAFLEGTGLEGNGPAEGLEGRLAAAFVRAEKPAGRRTPRAAPPPR